ncbi:MAG: hypothetical protein JWO05_3224 [Gemmatimonadetes bacterium]|nr:hypothetical protein [Gemmatimonadota bacterium]
MIAAHGERYAPRATFRIALADAFANRLGPAVSGIRRYLELEPTDAEARVALARTFAWAGRFDESIALYDSILVADPAARDVVLARAQTLAWASRFPASIAAYSAWTTAHPDDLEARLALARTYSWSGRLGDAQALYREIGGAASADAAKGIARVTGWEGDLLESERLWRSAVSSYPKDPEAWTGLAQVLRWRDQLVEAEDALQKALALSPNYGDARTQLLWVRADLRPSVEPIVTRGTDSDHNDVMSTSLAANMQAPWRGRAWVSGFWREAALSEQRGISSGGRVGASVSGAEGLWSLRGEVGANSLHWTGSCITSASQCPQAKTLAALSARLGVRPSRSLGLGFSLESSPFDETASLISRGLLFSAVSADADVRLPARFTLGAAAGIGRVTRGTIDNNRRFGSITLRRAFRRTSALALSLRGFGYDTIPREGYFTPRHYRLAEASGSTTVGRELGWSLTGEAGIGSQSIEPFSGATVSRLAERLNMDLTWRPLPGYEGHAFFGFANVASPGQVGAAEYRAMTYGLRARLRLR